MTTAARVARRDPTAERLGDEGLIDVGRRHLEAASLAQQHAVEGLARICEEGVRFTNLRMDENRRTFRQLASAQALPDTLSIWNEHFERTARQYGEEFGIVAGLCSDQARDAIGDLRLAAAASRETVAPNEA